MKPIRWNNVVAIEQETLNFKTEWIRAADHDREIAQFKARIENQSFLIASQRDAIEQHEKPSRSYERCSAILRLALPK